MQVKGRNKDMSIKDKIKSAKTDSWLAEGLTDEEIKEIIQSAKSEKIGFQYVEDTGLTPIQQEALDSLLST